jgi:hypothetical protein
MARELNWVGVALVVLVFNCALSSGTPELSMTPVEEPVALEEDHVEPSTSQSKVDDNKWLKDCLEKRTDGSDLDDCGPARFGRLFMFCNKQDETTKKECLSCLNNLMGGCTS